MYIYIMSRRLPIGMITGIPASIDNKYVSGSGVGAKSSSIRSALNRHATIPAKKTTVAATPIAPTQFITDRLIMHLDAGNVSSYPGSGASWRDLVGNKTFTLYNSPTYSPSNGGYITFNANSSQYAQSSIFTNTLTNWSVETWHYYTNTNKDTHCALVTELAVTANVNYTLGSISPPGSDNVNATTISAGYYAGSDSSWHSAPNPGYGLTQNNWYHIVGTYDGSKLSLYVNGDLKSQVSSSAPSISSGVDSEIALMKGWDSGYWGGNLAIVRIYNIGLSSSDIATNFSGQKSRFGL